MLRSLQRAKFALQLYYNSPPSDAEKLIIKNQALIQNPEWWLRLSELLHVLAPIDEAIKMSEADLAGIHHVIPRWKQLRRLLQIGDVFSMEAFNQRFRRQTNDCHLMAYLLNPNTVSDDEIPTYSEKDWRERAYAFFVHHGLNGPAAIRELNDFRKKARNFVPFSWIWSLDDPKEFWENAASLAPTIGSIAQRLMSTPCSSVPSERAWSILNLVHNKLRNRLSNDRVDKLQYIYINERVLRRVSCRYEAHLKLDEAQKEEEASLVELEDAFLFAGGTDLGTGEAGTGKAGTGKAGTGKAGTGEAGQMTLRGKRR